MKISHFSIIVISIFVISLTSTTGAFAQNSTTYSSSNDLGDGNVFFMTAKDLFLPGDLVEVNGSLITTNPIIITLDDPHGEMVTSKTTFSDREGYFTSELKIPANAEAGIWKIVGTSGIYHKELNFTITGNSDITTCYAGNLCSTFVANTTVQYGPKLVTQTTIHSPLKQIDNGIPTENITCSNDLELVYKASNKYPACVKHATAEKLIPRGWAIKGQPISYFIKIDGFLIPYDLVGGNMLGAQFDMQTHSLIFSVQHTTSSGVLYVVIPRALLDSKNAYSNQDTKFIILVDKHEIKYTETTSITNRTLSIPFDVGAKEIEIIAPVGI